jgi:hypothetical protein
MTDEELDRRIAERLAYHELRLEQEPSWKDKLDPETRRRVEERADEILAQRFREP